MARRTRPIIASAPKPDAPDRDFLARVLPLFPYVEYDVIQEQGALIRWFVEGTAVQVELSWMSDAVGVTIVTVPNDIKKVIKRTEEWDLKSNGLGVSTWTWTARDSQFGYTAGGVYNEDDHRYIAQFTCPKAWTYTHLAFMDHARDFVELVEGAVRRILSECHLIDPIDSTPMPHFPRLVDPEFVDMRAMLNGLRQRVVQ